MTIMHKHNKQKIPMGRVPQCQRKLILSSVNAMHPVNSQPCSATPVRLPERHDPQFLSDHEWYVPYGAQMSTDNPPPYINLIKFNSYIGKNTSRKLTQCESVKIYIFFKLKQFKKLLFSRVNCNV